SYRNPLLEVKRVEPQPVPRQRLDVVRPADERDRRAGPREHAAEVTADRPSTQHRHSRPSLVCHDASASQYTVNLIEQESYSRGSSGEGPLHGTRGTTK